MSDPTRPLVYTGPVKEVVVKDNNPKKKVVKKNLLKAIIIEDRMRKAIIDDRLVVVGNQINGYKVHKILPEKVVLKRGDALKTLRLTTNVKVSTKG